MYIEPTIIQKISTAILPIIFAVTLHEAAHAYAALYFGDSTAKQAGRITLDPRKHIDPVGTIFLPIFTLMFSPFLFGWAKPVPVNFANLRNPKKDMFWVAAAGPAANLIMAIFWILVLKAVPEVPAFMTLPLGLMAQAGITINLILMILNLLPLPPLDGGRIAVSLLPNDLARQFAKIEPYGFFILIALLFTGLLGTILFPMMNILRGILFQLFG